MEARIGAGSIASAYSAYARPVSKAITVDGSMTSVENRATDTPNATIEISSAGREKLAAAADGTVTAKTSRANITSFAGYTIGEVKQMYFNGSIDYRSYTEVTAEKKAALDQQIKTSQEIMNQIQMVNAEMLAAVI